MASYELSPEVFGQILTAKREMTGKTQADIAEALNIRNQNFIFTMEDGRAALPVARVEELLELYDLPREFSLVFLAVHYPDIFKLLKDLMALEGIENVVSDDEERAEDFLAGIVRKVAEQIAAES